MRNEDVIRELMTMMPPRLSGYQVCKSIVRLASEPAGTVRQIGPKVSGMRRPMLQVEAARLVAAARERIALVDEGD